MNIWNNALKRTLKNMKIFLKSKFNFILTSMFQHQSKNLKKFQWKQLTPILTRINL